MVELLSEEGVAREVLEAAVETAERTECALVSALVDQGVPEDVLADVVARAVGTVVIDVELGALDQEAVHILPEELARDYLLIGVATGPEALRVAFANPLDEKAIEAVRAHSGLEVEPLVATVSGLRAALDREHQRSATQVIRARKDLPVEVTRQMRAETRELSVGPTTERPPASSGTSPLHRIEQDAPLEQRHDALLLALVEAGVLTRADYIRALQRLKGREPD